MKVMSLTERCFGDWSSSDVYNYELQTTCYSRSSTKKYVCSSATNFYKLHTIVFYFKVNSDRNTLQTTTLCPHRIHLIHFSQRNLHLYGGYRFCKLIEIVETFRNLLLDRWKLLKLYSSLSLGFRLKERIVVIRGKYTVYVKTTTLRHIEPPTLVLKTSVCQTQTYDRDWNSQWIDERRNEKNRHFIFTV